VVRLIKGFLRLGIRLGLIAGIGFALFKLVKGRRAEYGSPSADWAPAPAPNPNLPKPVPEPELITPVELHELIEKKAAEKAEAVAVEKPSAQPVPGAVALVGESAVKKTRPPAKKAAAKKAAEPAAAGPVKKVAPKKAAAAKKAAPAAEAEKAPVAPKKAAPVKKAAKKPEQ
jgi:hypothetical protein